MRHKKAIVILGLLVIVIMATTVSLGPRLVCQMKGGRWGRVGLNPAPQCNMPTSDAGKTCTDTKECEGTCMAELSAEDMAKLRRGEVILSKGKCTAWKLGAGCVVIIQDGRAVMICID